MAGLAASSVFQYPLSMLQEENGCNKVNDLNNECFSKIYFSTSVPVPIVQVAGGELVQQGQ